MQQNAQINQRARLITHAQREQCIADKPRCHTNQQHDFHAKTAEQQWNDQHENNFRHLTQ